MKLIFPTYSQYIRQNKSIPKCDIHLKIPVTVSNMPKILIQQYETYLYNNKRFLGKIDDIPKEGFLDAMNQLLDV